MMVESKTKTQSAGNKEERILKIYAPDGPQGMEIKYGATKTESIQLSNKINKLVKKGSTEKKAFLTALEELSLPRMDI